MRGRSRAIGTAMWRELIELLDEGVIVFNNRGVVIYSNDAAAQLLNYPSRGVLDLEKDDLVALCQAGRLDAQRFETAFMGDVLPDRPSDTYTVATSRRRLRLRPFDLMLENGRVTVVLLGEDYRWREHLIAETVISEGMDGPLALASGYTETLVSQLKDGSALPFELENLAQIVHRSVERARRLWESLARLHNTRPERREVRRSERVDLSEALRRAAQSVGDHNRISINMPGKIPPVAALPDNLDAALESLLDGATSRLGPHETLDISVQVHERYVRLDISAGSDTLQGYLFDKLPLAVAEQLAQGMGGRLWNDRQTGMLHLTLPLWEDAPPS